MPYPKNPNTIVIKNKFFKSGLKEIDIWNYYQKVKVDLIKEFFNRDLMVFIMTELNKPIIRRRMKNGKNIRINSKNYDEMMSGRSVSFHSTMKNIEDFGIIDIDIDPRDQFSLAQKTTAEVYNYVNNIPMISNATIRFTGKTSFHILCKFYRKNKIENIKFLLKDYLMDSYLSKKYSIGGRRKRGLPNLDLSLNKQRGNFITLHSLSIFGLRCMEINYKNLATFNPYKAKP